MVTLVHFEIPATEMEKSRDFYQELFGWKFQPFSDDYLSFDTGDGSGGGIYKVEEIHPSQVNLYFKVEDIPQTLERAVDLGGLEMQPKTSIGEHGFIGTIADPCGFHIGLWSKD